MHLRSHTYMKHKTGKPRMTSMSRRGPSRRLLASLFYHGFMTTARGSTQKALHYLLLPTLVIITMMSTIELTWGLGIRVNVPARRKPVGSIRLARGGCSRSTAFELPSRPARRGIRLVFYHNIYRLIVSRQLMSYSNRGFPRKRGLFSNACHCTRQHEGYLRDELKLSESKMRIPGVGLVRGHHLA